MTIEDLRFWNGVFVNHKSQILNHTLTMSAKSKPKSKIKEPEKNVRPPIVVVMGHVDHGKTKILDYIRKAKVAEGESGGITQHIGAYEVAHKGNRITFIDTPGHEAFSAMRSRGAQIADIAVLVVAAEEGVKPQTKEAIRIIKDAGLPFVVALNKIDKSEANPDKVKQELAENDIQVESWGGKIPSVNVSAKTGEGMDELLDTILLLTELEELVWHPAVPATGVVIESHRDNQVGNTATLLLRDGTLTKKHILVFGRGKERVKMIKDFTGRPLDAARASMPVVLSGFHELPAVGEPFRAFETKDAAEQYHAEEEASAQLTTDNLKATALELAQQPTTSTTSPEEEASEKQDTEKDESAKEQKRAIVFPLILKSDMAGSKEALDSMMLAMHYPEIEVRLIKSDVGDVNESDVKFAIAARASIIAGFRVEVLPEAKQLAENYRIRIVTRDVIYELADEIKKAMEDALPGEIKENEMGRLTVLALFKKDGTRQVIGGKVETGVMRKGLKCKIMRGEKLVGSCKLTGLQREKTAATEVAKGAECGCAIDTEVRVGKGDTVVVFEEEKVRRKL